MKKLFTFLVTCLAVCAYAATEPAWYNDVTAITNNGQYYIYSVNGKGFVQGGQNKVKSVTSNNYSSNSDLLFTVTKAEDGKAYNGSNYISSYQAGTCGPVGSASDDGSNLVWTSMDNGKYWNIHGKYAFSVFGTKYACLQYTGSKYDATANVWGNKETQTDAKYQWYLISQAQYNRHWAIYLFETYKEGKNIAPYADLVPTAYYDAVAAYLGTTYDVKNTAVSAEQIRNTQIALKALWDELANIQTAYANAKEAINNLEAVEDKGEDFVQITSDINTARTAIDAATTVDAVNAAVAGLKAIDPITFNETTFMAGQALGTPASTVAGRTITYEAADKNIINAAGQPIYKGTTTLTATAAATNEYYKFVRSAQVTVNAENTDAQESKTITYGTNESWHGTNLSTYTVGSHELTFDTLNIYGGNHTITLTLTVNKIATLEVPVALAFCPGGSETYRGVEYTEAGTFPVNAIGATRDTIYNVTVTILQPTFGTDNKTIVVGAQETWNGIDLSTYTVGSHQVPFVTTNAAGCDSTVTLNLTVNKMETLNVPVELAFCPGGSETYRGVEYTEAGTFPVNATGATRDTVYNVTVTILQPTFGTDNKTIACGAQETWNGIDLSTYTVGSHQVPFVTTNIAGCDSTVTLNLVVTKANSVEIPVELAFCEGDSAEYRGTYYTTAGLYPVYAEGEVADTVYNVNVTVNQHYYNVDNKNVTVGETLLFEEDGWMLRGETPVTGSYPTTKADTAALWFAYYGQTLLGCDSIEILNVTIELKSPLETEQNLEFCAGDSVQYRGVWYAEAGEYPVYAEGEIRDTLINVIVTVHEVPIVLPALEYVIAGQVVILPEGEWFLGDSLVVGTFETVPVGDTTTYEFIRYAETEFECAYIDKYVVVVTPNYEAIDNVFVGEQAQKFFRDGQLYIRRGEEVYTLTGERVE